MKHVVVDITAEADDLSRKHGDMPARPEAVYYHTTRAYRSLEERLLAKDQNRAAQVERLVHLAAVCLRAAEALSA